MQMNRLFEIVYLLLEKKNMKARDLAEHFEVSVRTIYRDIETLSQAGIPLYANKGRGGGIGLLEDFVLNKSVLSGEEQSEILWALQGIHAVKGADNKAILSKLTSLFGNGDTNWLRVDFSGWGDQEQGLFNQLKTALIQKRVLEFDYYNSAGEKKHRTAEPLQLWFKDKAWYLKAYCQSSRDYRLFKLSRLRHIQVLETRFTRELPDDEAKRELTRARDAMISVRLHIDRSQAFRVFDEFGDQFIEKQADGSFIATLTCPHNDWVYSYILSYGEMAKVLEPEAVKCVLADKLQKMQTCYV